MIDEAGRTSGAFTLIELLVVVAIIALLVAVLVPSLSEAKWLAKVSMCATNLHNVGVAVQSYSSSCGMDRPWLFADGGGDAPHEGYWSHSPLAPGNPALAMCNPGFEQFLDSAEIFFCPAYPLNYEDHYEMNPSLGTPGVWGTYMYRFYFAGRSEDPYHPELHANYMTATTTSEAKQLIMHDYRSSSWAANGYVGTYGPILYEHYNALLVGGTVEPVARDSGLMTKFLWGP